LDRAVQGAVLANPSNRAESKLLRTGEVVERVIDEK
jgi:hypothetical protein